MGCRIEKCWQTRSKTSAIVDEASWLPLLSLFPQLLGLPFKHPQRLLGDSWEAGTPTGFIGNFIRGRKMPAPVSLWLTQGHLEVNGQAQGLSAHVSPALVCWVFEKALRWLTLKAQFDSNKWEGQGKGREFAVEKPHRCFWKVDC